MNQKLEEISWKDGRFINHEKKKVNPKIIGLPLKIASDIIYDSRRDPAKEIKNKLKTDLVYKKELGKAIKEINSYSINEINCSHGLLMYLIQFYKI